MTIRTPRAVLALLAAFLAPMFCACGSMSPMGDAMDDPAVARPETMLIQYLEIVTPDVNATCTALGKMHGVTFGEPDPGFGNARSAELSGGGRIGVRAPMRSDEAPVVRPYLLVNDIDVAIAAAEAAGAEVAVPPMAMPGHGKFAIYLLGGIDHGLWQR